MIYRGSRDGFIANAFHAKCDNQGASLIIIKLETGDGRQRVLGAFTDIPWASP